MSLVFASFEEYGHHKGISPAQPKTKKPQTCRKCGAVLREITGTNVMVCDGEVKNPETQKVEPCGNKILRNRVNPS